MIPRICSCVCASRSFSSSATFAFAEVQAGKENLHPAFALQPSQHAQRIFLVRNLFQLVAAWNDDIAEMYPSALPVS